MDSVSSHGGSSLGGSSHGGSGHGGSSHGHNGRGGSRGGAGSGAKDELNQVMLQDFIRTFRRLGSTPDSMGGGYKAARAYAELCLEEGLIPRQVCVSE